MLTGTEKLNLGSPHSFLSDRHGKLKLGDTVLDRSVAMVII